MYKKEIIDKLVKSKENIEAAIELSKENTEIDNKHIDKLEKINNKVGKLINNLLSDISTFDNKPNNKVIKKDITEDSKVIKLKPAYIARFRVNKVCDVKLLVDVSNESITLLSKSILCASNNVSLNKMHCKNNKIRRESMKLESKFIDGYSGKKLELVTDYKINNLNFRDLKELILGRPLTSKDSNKNITYKHGNLEELLLNKE